MFVCMSLCVHLDVINNLILSMMLSSVDEKDYKIMQEYYIIVTGLHKIAVILRDSVFTVLPKCNGICSQ